MSQRTKVFLIFIYLQCLCIGATAQDLLVNFQGDSLNVKIVEVDAVNIHYSMPYSENVYQYPVRKAKTYSRGYFVEGSKNDSANKTDNTSSSYSAHTTLRAHLHGGWSTLLGQVSEETPDQLVDYSENLRTGYNYGIGLDVFIHRYIGFGAQFAGFSTANEMTDYTTVDEESGETITGIYAEKISINSFDFKLIGRFPFEKDRLIFFSFIAGNMVLYSNDANVLGVAFKLKSGTFGASGGMGFDYKIDQSFAIGIQVNVLAAQLNEYELQNSFGQKVADIEDDTYNNISRLDISLGLRWYL